jgi:hypothetical protein
MIRAIIPGALLAALATVGLAWGQSPTWVSAGGAQAQATEALVTVQDKGGVPEECRLLKVWTTEDGRKAWLVQTVAADELITVVQPGTIGPDGRQRKSDIYHWSNNDVPPRGSPVPPPDGRARQTSFEDESPESRPIKTLPPVAPTTVTPAGACGAPTAMPAESCGPKGCCAGATCGTCGSGSKHCTFTHVYEQPRTIKYKPGCCLPVMTPDCMPSYGYFPTQWRPYCGVAGVPQMVPEQTMEPDDQPELLSPPKISPMSHRR